MLMTKIMQYCFHLLNYERKSVFILCVKQLTTKSITRTKYFWVYTIISDF